MALSFSSSKGNFKINHFKKGLSLAKNIFANGEMETYAKLIAGERYSYNSEKLFHFYLNEIIESVKPVFDKDDGISIKEFISLFSTFPTEAYQYIKNRFPKSGAPALESWARIWCVRPVSKFILIQL